MLRLGSSVKRLCYFSTMARKVPKKLIGELEASYNPAAVEKGWYEWWESSGLFSPSNVDEANISRQKWVAILPPPNVTGSLHIGHALTVSIQDCLARWHRMKGDLTLWIPGTDHAGIATQTVVERMLMQTENKTRHDLGRVEFVKKVFEWNDKYGNNIKNQLRRIGASLDWTRDAFTMDKQRSAAVVEAFVQMYNAGLIYRATRLVSWCPHLSTALSDIEVDTFEVTAPIKISIPGFKAPVEVGVLWVFKYLVDTPGQNKYVSVATSRIETMLGDVGVAVHPNDGRYTDIIGCKLLHPFIKDRHMVVVADEHVDMSYGTGAVKLTPAHDKSDFDIAKRHGLPCFNIFTNDGKINENGGEFAGLHRFECRMIIEQRLKDLQLFENKIANTKPMSIPRCSRTGDILEYMMIPQWYVDCSNLAKEALEHVRKGELTLMPSSYVSVWEMWLENIQDWCVSRQLWWGHRIPAYRIVGAGVSDNEEKWIVAKSLQEAQEQLQLKCPELAHCILQQDEDVLDTWFSSGIFPLSTLGWPDIQFPDYKTFFPTNLLETGNDILFFWVARMVMMSKQLVGKLPFTHVYLHPLVRDARGEKMSKSKGNVIDPLEVIDGVSLEKLNDKIINSTLPKGEVKKALLLQKQQFPIGIPACGTDALRLGLLGLTRQNRTILLDVNKLVCCRHFGNKIWNATKFALNKIQGNDLVQVEESAKAWEDKWILHKLNKYIEKVTTAFEAYQFGDAVQAAYDFWIYELCDVYIELVKTRLPAATDANVELTQDMQAAIYALNNCLNIGLRLLHPIMPFITEELFQHLPQHLRTSDSICNATFPKPNKGWYLDNIETEMQLVGDAVHSLRSLSAVLGLAPQVKNKIGYVVTPDGKAANLLKKLVKHVATLAKFEQVILKDVSADFSDCVGDVVNANLSTYINIDEGVDLAATIKRLQVRAAKISAILDSYKKKQHAPGYEKVPESVKKLNEEKITELSIEKEHLDNALGDLNRLHAVSASSVNGA